MLNSKTLSTGLNNQLCNKKNSDIINLYFLFFNKRTPYFEEKKTKIILISSNKIIN